MTEACHHFIISLGSNHNPEHYIPYALVRLREQLDITRESEIMLTDPVNFPYPSGLFTNVILEGMTGLNQGELLYLLHSLEEYAGRDRATPQLVSLDADLITWNDAILKPKDMQRPYFKAYLQTKNDERNI